MVNKLLKINGCQTNTYFIGRFYVDSVKSQVYFPQILTFYYHTFNNNNNNNNKSNLVYFSINFLLKYFQPKKQVYVIYKLVFFFSTIFLANRNQSQIN